MGLTISHGPITTGSRSQRSKKKKKEQSKLTEGVWRRLYGKELQAALGAKNNPGRQPARGDRSQSYNR